QYLGSKLRLVGHIKALVDELCEPNFSVCDLFSGSGVVSHSLASKHPVIAVDIQHYACVLASALLTPKPATTGATADIMHAAANGPLVGELRSIFEPLIVHEQECIAAALSGD